MISLNSSECWWFKGLLYLWCFLEGYHYGLQTLRIVWTKVFNYKILAKIMKIAIKGQRKFFNITLLQYFQRIDVYDRKKIPWNINLLKFSGRDYIEDLYPLFYYESNLSLLEASTNVWFHVLAKLYRYAGVLCRQPLLISVNYLTWR